MAIKRVSLSWVSVKDVKKSKEFFTKTLGLAISEEQEKYGWLELTAQKDNVMFGVCKGSKENHAPGKNAIITFEVDNYDQIKKELEGKGVKFFGEMAGYPGVPRMILFKDPDGNTFQLVEEETTRA